MSWVYPGRVLRINILYMLLLNVYASVLADGTEEYDSEGSDSEEDEDLEGAPNGMYLDQEDSDDEEESEDSDEADGFAHRSSVIIEEVHDIEQDGVHITSTTAAKVHMLLPLLLIPSPPFPLALVFPKKHPKTPPCQPPATPHPMVQAPNTQ